MNSALQRARQTTGERVPEQSQQATLRALGDERCRELVNRYMDALDHADVDALLALLTDEPVWAMPPLTTLVPRPRRRRAFLAEYAVARCAGATSRPARAASSPSAATPGTRSGATTPPPSSTCSRVRDDRIAEVTGFIDPRLFPRFGLPERIAG